jgi:hypothetical protein
MARKIYDSLSSGFVFITLFSLPALAQTQSAAIRGVIQDATGSSVSAAQVTLISVTQRQLH